MCALSRYYNCEENLRCCRYINTLHDRILLPANVLHMCKTWCRHRERATLHYTMHCIVLYCMIVGKMPILHFFLRKFLKTSCALIPRLNTNTHIKRRVRIPNRNSLLKDMRKLLMAAWNEIFTPVIASKHFFRPYNRI